MRLVVYGHAESFDQFTAQPGFFLKSVMPNAAPALKILIKVAARP
jgi:hypothetical protein